MHLRVAWRTHRVGLLFRERFCADDVQRRFLAFGSLLEHFGMLPAGPMTRFAVDTRLDPRRVIRVRSQIVVRRELAHVATVAGGVERIGAFTPVYGPVLSSARVTHAAHRHVEPFLLSHVIGKWQRLEHPAVCGSQEVIDVLSAHCVRNWKDLFALRASLANAGRARCKIDAICVFTDSDLAGLRREGLLRKSVRERLHGKPVKGGRPKFVEPFVAGATAPRPGKTRRQRLTGNILREGRAARADECHGTARHPHQRPFGQGFHGCCFSRPPVVVLSPPSHDPVLSGCNRPQQIITQHRGLPCQNARSECPPGSQRRHVTPFADNGLIRFFPYISSAVSCIGLFRMIVTRLNCCASSGTRIYGKLATAVPNSLLATRGLPRSRDSVR